MIVSELKNKNLGTNF